MKAMTSFVLLSEYATNRNTGCRNPAKALLYSITSILNNPTRPRFIKSKLMVSNPTPTCPRSIVMPIVAAGCLLLPSPLLVAQAANQAMSPAVGSPAASQDEDIIILSPFQVDATRDKGYFAENTLAGSRMRTNIADLGAAISVVTKQQLEDTASLDVNDIFRYELNTEGSTTYTPTTLSARSDGVADQIAGNSWGSNLTTATNATANRIRGLGAPSSTINYYSAIAAIPFDSYNAASVEINRGPNSILFGMGSPAGIVNMSTEQASLARRQGKVQMRVDSRGSDRAVFSYDLPLINDKLGVYFALLHNNQQFQRKPSHDKSSREYVALTYKPFKATTIRANVEWYRNSSRRQNSLMPRDGVTEWRNAGEPYYDALTQQIVSRTTGNVLGVYAPSAQSPSARQLLDFIQAKDPGAVIANNKYNGINIFNQNAQLMTTAVIPSGPRKGQPNPFYVPGVAIHHQRPVQQIADGAIQAWTQGLVRQATGFVAGTDNKEYAFNTSGNAANKNIYVTNPAAAAVYDRTLTEFDPWSLNNNDETGVFGKLYPAVTDPAIYDWRDINILGMNFGRQRNRTFNIEFEQELFPRLLTFSAGWFQQDYKALQSYTVAQMNAATLQVDTNKYYPDGTPNPFFGRVYVMDNNPDRISVSQRNNQYRAMLGFTPDFTASGSWTRWLGRHQILGMVSYGDEMNAAVRQRLAFYDGSPAARNQYLATNPSLPGFAYQDSFQNRRNYYLSGSGVSVNKGIDAGAYNDDLISSAIRLYDYATGQWTDQPLSLFWADFRDAANRTKRSQRTLKSSAVAWTGYLWNDRITTTLGVRHDINSTRETTTGTLNGEADLARTQLYNDGYLQTDMIFDRWADWSQLTGTTTTAGAVVKPFLGWNLTGTRSRGRGLFREAIENIGFSYNRSSNFDAPAATYIDYFGSRLPKPEGRGQDYGVQVAMLSGALFARLNWFEASNENIPQSPQVMQRLYNADIKTYRSWLGFIYMLNDGLDLRNADWKSVAQGYVNNAGMQQWTAEKWGLNNWDYYTNLPGTLGATSEVQAKGIELTVQYNPARNLTVKLTASKSRTVNTRLLQEFDRWKVLRKAQWDAAEASGLLTPAVIAKYPNITTGYYSAADGTDVSLVDFWHSYGYYDTTDNGITIRSDHSDPTRHSNLAFYNYTVLTPELAQKALDGQQMPGQRQYNASLVANYSFDSHHLKGWSVGGGQRYSSRAIIGNYGRASGDNVDSLGRPLLDMPDVNRPIYDEARWYTDLWIAYTRKIAKDKIRMKVQLNVADIFQDGELQPIAVNYDGTAYAYRILDPRTFMLSATFEF